MSDALYESNPSMFRNHPLWFVFWLLIIVAGIGALAAGPDERWRLIGFVTIFVGIVVLFVWFLKTKALTLIVSDRNVVLRTGLLSKSYSELAIDRIRSVRVRQSLLNRMLGVGSVEIFSAGDDPEIAAAGIPNPQRVRDLLRGRGAEAAGS